ncbi:MAG: hypothetical protein CMJ85_08030 [Planctomycetes bacterium]|nr:hypothetical protein [Planctomycetota bacterium]MDP6425287.1 GatB/YqeY domain-containing protein [Planctomycetota bacterium]
MSGAIQARLTADMKTAMKAGEKDRLLLIRMLISDLKNEQMKLNHEDLTEDEEFAVLRRASKMRKDAAEQARNAGRTDTAEKEEAEIVWIEGYLPQQLDTAEIEAKAREMIAELDIASRADQGRFMKEWMARYRAVSDGKIVNQVLGKLLS